MKIIEIIPHLKSGGAEQFVVDISSAFVQMGNECYLITLFDRQQDELFYLQLDERIKCYSLAKKIGHDWRIFLKLYKLINSIRPDVVHFHIGAIKYGILSVLLYRRCKYFATIHSEAKREAGKGIEKLLRRFMFGCNLMSPITISAESEISFKKFYGYHALMIPNGRASYKQIDLSELALKYHSDVDYLFVHAGRIHSVKNQKMLISAVEKLQDEGYRIRLLIMGRETDSDIMRFIRNHSSDTIKYLGEKSNIRDYMAISDAFCLSSVQEGLPITIIESLSVGTPIVATPVGGCVGIVQDAQTGFLARDLSQTSYIDALKKLIATNKEDRSRMRAICRQTFNEKYAVEICAIRYMTVFCSDEK